LNPSLRIRSVKPDARGVGREIGHWTDDHTDEILEVYAVSGTYDEIAARVEAKYEGYLYRVMFCPLFAREEEKRWRAIAEIFNG
jgi:alkanesulfonate monooxygenase SsuD/methylene tetrahydromethanopterin reductase-like flavin-dependent oxidoreductase (luciferase family)